MHTVLKILTLLIFVLSSQFANQRFVDLDSLSLVNIPSPSNQHPNKKHMLDTRGTFKSKEKSIMLPSEYEGVKGQQGFTNYRVFIAL